MSRLAAVPSGSMVDPCCCFCHDAYGDNIEGATSDIEVCECTQMNDPSSDFDGQDISIEIISGDINGVGAITWDGTKWVSGTVALAQFTVWTSTDLSCSGDEIYTEAIPLIREVTCNPADGKFTPIITGTSTDPELGTWTFFAPDAPGGSGDFDEVFDNIFLDCGGAYVGGFNGTFTLADTPG